MTDWAYYGRIWLPAFIVAQVAAVGVALMLDPAGFDHCEAVASTATRSAQATAGGLAVLGTLALGLWRFRGRYLGAVLVPALAATAGWVWLLGEPGTC